MGASRTVAGNVLGVLQAFHRDGVEATLARLNLAEYVGRPIEDVFLALTNLVCPDGGPIDEGVALDSWLETVASLEAMGVSDPAALSAEQMREVFIEFIVRSIEARVFQDVGAKALDVAPDLAGIDRLDRQLCDYIRGAVSDVVPPDVVTAGGLGKQEIAAQIEAIYRDTWDLLLTWGDATT